MPTPTEGDDILNGTAGADTISGLGGNDTIDGGTGNDYLDGGAGNDRIYTGDGADTVIGGSGDDEINGYLTTNGSYSSRSSAGPLKISGGDGNDFILGSSGNDTLDGEGGSDFILTGGGDDIVTGGDGNDLVNSYKNPDGTVSFYRFAGTLNINGGAGADILRGAAGNDTIFGGTEDDDLNGLLGDDFLSGDAGDDVLYGNEGNDTLEGGAGADKLYGEVGDDKLYGGEGNDTLEGGDGNDLLDGGTGNDRIITGNGADTVMGGDGDDEINGYSTDGWAYKFWSSVGALNVSGGQGSDFIVGSSGDDTLDGGAGADKLYGRDGNDYYVVDDRSDYVSDNQGANTGLVKVDFFKQPTGVTWTLDTGVKELPYWIDALVKGGTAYSDAQKSVAAGVIRYAFPTSVLSTWSDQDKAGFASLNADQKAFVQKCLAYIETLINVKFQLVSDASQAGVLTFANNAQTNSGGYASGSQSSLNWGVFFNNTGTGAAANAAPRDGNFGALTFLHEIGHALGLKHPFEKADSLGNVADGPYLPLAENTVDATVMAYAYDPRTTYPSTYDDIDIAALQYLYGPAVQSGTAYHQTGDTLYALSTSSYNFIWDGGGIDTLDASSAALRVVLNLEVGEHSYFGSSPSPYITAAGQITINIGTVIENASGTAYDDVISGNAAANYIWGKAGNDSLLGGAGDDMLRGGLGDDTLDGGDGVDVVYYNGEGFASGIIVDIQAGTVTGGAGNDKLVFVERVWGSERADRFYGSAANDYFIGDAGDDYADGRDGTDIFQINNDFADCTFYQDGLTCVIVTKSLGTDRLDNFERVAFVGTTTVWKTIAELQALTSTNGAPVFSATNQSVTTNEDTTKAITVNATDPDNEALTYTVSTAPGRGTTVISGGTITYTPDKDFNGADSFVVTASDGKGATAKQTINVTVTPLNDAPVFGAATQAVFTTAGIAKTVSLSATDVDGDTLTYTVTAPSKGSAKISGSTLTYTPAATASGTDSVFVTAQDPSGATATQEIKLSINPTSGAYLSAFEAFDYTTINLNKLISNQISWNFISKANAIFDDKFYEDVSIFEYYYSGFATAVFGGNGFQYALESDGFYKPVSGTVTGYVQLSGSKTSTDIMWYISNFEYSAVKFSNAAFTSDATDDLQIISEILSGNDYFDLSPYRDIVDGFAGDDEIWGYGGNDALNGGAGNDKIYGGAGADYLSGDLGSDTIDGGADFDYVAYDEEVVVDLALGFAKTASGTDNLSNIEGVFGSNYADTLIGDKNDNWFVLTAGKDVIRGGGSSQYGDVIWVAGTFSEYSISRNVDGSISIKKPSAPSVDTTLFDVTLIYSSAESVIRPLANLLPNVGPIFASSSQSTSTAEDISKVISLSATDENRDSLTYSVSSAPSNGTATVAGTSVNYTPKKDYSGTDSFVVTVSDGRGGTASQTINLTVTPVNDAPSFSAASQSVTATAGAAKTISLSATDVDGDALTYTVATPGKGTAVISGSTLTYTPSSTASGSDSFVVTASDGKGGIAAQTINATILAASTFRMTATTGWSGSIGGLGSIVGTAGYQDVVVLSGSVTFDASFNKGGDIIRFGGPPNNFTVSLIGSSARIASEAATAVVPVGVVGAGVAFSDRQLNLIYADRKVQLGGQTVTPTATVITAANDGSSLPSGADQAATAKVFLLSDMLPAGMSAHVIVGGRATVVGTAANHIVAVDDNTPANLTFDPSFNRGGDTIVLGREASNYSAARLGSSVVLTASDQKLIIPIGTAGMTLRFVDGDRTLVFKNSAFYIGEQAVTSTTAVALNPSTITLSADQGEPVSSVTLDATGRVIFADDASKTTNVILVNFGKDDLIRVTGATALDYNFTLSSEDPRDLEITYSDPVTSAFNLIVLDNVIANDTFVVDYETAAQAVGWNFMAFG